jgi:hypothetical protein
MNATHRLADGVWRTNAGHVRIVLGACLLKGQALDLAATPLPPKVITLYAAASGDMAGTELYAADWNGDGYSDLAIGAQNQDGPGPEAKRVNAGAAYLFWGGPAIAESPEIDLASPAPAVLTIYGAGEGDHTGVWLGAGDMDGDGRRDLILGANQADGAGDSRAETGEAWILYGTADWAAAYGPAIDLASPPDSATHFLGADPGDVLGSAFLAGDWDGDGLDDLFLTASIIRASAGVGGYAMAGGDCAGNTGDTCGEVYLLLNRGDWRGRAFEMGEWIDAASGEPLAEWLAIFYEVRDTETIGEDLAAGDFDGDGRLDIALGSLQGEGINDALPEAGEAWVIFDPAAWAGRAWRVQEPPPPGSLMLYADQTQSLGGDSLRAGDWDGDGRTDLFFTIPHYHFLGPEGDERTLSGLVVIIPGGSLSPEGGHLSVMAPPEGAGLTYILGAGPFDMTGYIMSLYDLDGDGRPEALINAMGGDGAGDALPDAGEVYIVWP